MYVDERCAHDIITNDSAICWWHLVSVADAMGVLCADTVPIALRCVMGKTFTQGPFKLGFLQPLINVSAVVYMVVSVVGIASLAHLMYADFHMYILMLA